MKKVRMTRVLISPLNLMTHLVYPTRKLMSPSTRLSNRYAAPYPQAGYTTGCVDLI